MMETFALDKVIYVVAGSDSRKPHMTPAETRYDMARSLLKLFSPLFECSSIALGGSSSMAVEDPFPPAPLALKITFHAHSTLTFTYGTTVIHVDPVGQFADWATAPKADLILITHEHSDHLDLDAIKAARQEGTVIVGMAKCAAALPGLIALHNGDSRAVKGIRVEAVPAYNVRHEKAPGKPFHPKGEGNGYVAGDTENTREM
jgi:phosphoribosyl 1,2-cyclic phosphodiesterase